MSTDKRESPGGASGDSKGTELKAHSKSSRPTQIERVRRMLDRGWMCGLDFLDPPDGYAPILRYQARIHELRKAGYYIDRRPCAHPWHDHRESSMWQWHIEGHTADGRLPGTGNA